ncbi:unnamed protein product [Closterium sp. Naga37s-1]|nr:unnamed protein product [Closterium sp. Naga37s-1]
MITQEFREKEREQAALAKQYGVAADVGSDSTAGREAQAPDKAGADADDSPAAGDSGSTGHTASSHQSSAARRLGLDLPQSGVGPTQENVARAKEVREIAKHPPDAGAAGEGASPGAGLGPGIVDVAHGGEGEEEEEEGGEREEGFDDQGAVRVCDVQLLQQHAVRLLHLQQRL